MASTIKEKVANAGQAIADTAKNVGHKIVADTKKAVDVVKEKTGMGSAMHCDNAGASIKENMAVIASCGKQVGVVDHLEGRSIKLTKKDSPDEQHHFIPVEWVDRVDSRVHLKKNSLETEQGWKSDAASCGCA